MSVSTANLRLWIAATRPFALPASLMGVLVGTAIAARPRQWRWGILVAELVAVALLHSISNLLNDYGDFRSGVDRRTADDEGRPGRFLVYGTLQPRQVLFIAFACGILLAPLAAYLIRAGGWPAVALGLFGALGGYAYTGRPFVLKYRGLGELCIFLVFGPPIVVGAAYMQTGQFEPRALLLSVPLGMLIVAIVSANNLRDIEEDAQGGIVTLAGLVGGKAYRLFYLLLLFGAPAGVVALVACRLAPVWSLLALGSLPLAIPPARCALRRIRRPDADVITAQYMGAFGALMFVGLVLA